MVPFAKTIFLVGSSMVQRAFDPKWDGFAIGLSHWYTRVADLIVRGQSGYNSRWTLLTIPELIGSYTPDMCILFLGNNDSITSGTGQHVPVEEYRSNMMSIMYKFRDVNPNISFLLLSPTRATKLGRLDEVTALYYDAVRDLSTQIENTAFVDLWSTDSLFWVDPVADLHDGLHLNNVGNQKVLAAIQHTIKTHFPMFVPAQANKEEPSDIVKFVPSAVPRTTTIPPQSDNEETVDTIDECVSHHGLPYLFPEWFKLTGKSVEEATLLIDAAALRLRSSL